MSSTLCVKLQEVDGTDSADFCPQNEHDKTLCQLTYGSLTATLPRMVEISLAHGRLPSEPKEFENEKDQKWKLEVMSGTDKSQKLPHGTIYSNSCHRLGFDKARTSCIDGKVFWNFGDCLSVDGIIDGCDAGFSMGAAFYASKGNPLEVNMVRIDMTEMMLHSHSCCSMG